MRITAGSLRGRIVSCPKGEIRPAMDRMRESLFSILGDISNYSFLDLFSGSSLMALEAYSRGAKDIVCVEMDKGKKKTILENLEMAKGEIKLYLSSAQTYISRCKRSFDIIYLDPPFPLKKKEDLLDLICKNKKILNENTIVIMHYPSEDQKYLDKKFSILENYDLRKYGRSLVGFYKVVENEI